MINATVHGGRGLFLPQALHYSFLSNPALVAKMREASEATLATEHAAELLLYFEPATLDTCHAHQLVGCLKSPSANLCSRALAARVLCALDGEQLVPHVADLVASAMLSCHPAQCTATPLINRNSYTPDSALRPPATPRGLPASSVDASSTTKSMMV